MSLQNAVNSELQHMELHRIAGLGKKKVVGTVTEIIFWGL